MAMDNNSNSNSDLDPVEEPRSTCLDSIALVKQICCAPRWFMVCLHVEKRETIVSKRGWTESDE
jgi:hypothetical protein